MGGVEYFGMGVGMGATFSNAANITTPITTASGVSPAYLYGLPSATDSLRIDDLLDFSNQEAFPAAAAAGVDNLLLPPTEPSSAITGGSSSSDFQSNLHCSFTDELYFPVRRPNPNRAFSPEFNDRNIYTFIFIYIYICSG